LKCPPAFACARRPGSPDRTIRRLIRAESWRRPAYRNKTPVRSIGHRFLFDSGWGLAGAAHVGPAQSSTPRRTRRHRHCPVLPVACQLRSV
jgi:hypothetical protein